MQIYRDQLVMRIGGTLCSVGFVLVGCFVLFGGGDAVDALARERAMGFGVCALLAGIIALPLSWLVQRIDNIWCAPPRKGWFRTTSSIRPDSVRLQTGAGSRHTDVPPFIDDESH